jgi:signal transduction histidine kinase
MEAKKMQYMDSEKNNSQTLSPGLWPALEWTPETWLTMFDCLPCPVVVFQADGTLLLVNSEAARLLSLAGKEGQLLPKYLAPLLNGAAVGDDRRRLEPIVTAEGLFMFSLKRLPVNGSGGRIVAVGQAAAKPAARESFEDSAVMAGEVSQKVKGPLAGIELYASILGEELSEAGDSALTPLIDEIMLSVRELNEYLTSFESMTRILNLEQRSFDLAEAVDEALGKLGEVFKARGVGVLVDQRPLAVQGDRRLMVQVFLNLFLNAVEAMPQGGRLSVDMRINLDGQAEVAVADTGPGVKLYNAKEVFNPFYTTKDQPLGLGLPVSRRIVEAHQGRIVLGTDMAFGARVTVTLPSFPETTWSQTERTVN